MADPSPLHTLQVAPPVISPTMIIQNAWMAVANTQASEYSTQYNHQYIKCVATEDVLARLFWLQLLVSVIFVSGTVFLWYLEFFVPSDEEAQPCAGGRWGVLAGHKQTNEHPCDFTVSQVTAIPERRQASSHDSIVTYNIIPSQASSLKHIMIGTLRECDHYELILITVIQMTHISLISMVLP